MVLRASGPGDVAACAALHQEWLDSEPWMPDLHDRATTERWMRQHLFPAHDVIIAEINGAVRGFLALEDSGCVSVLTVGSGWRRRGVGQSLLDAAKARHPGGLSLWTFLANEGAQRFYARAGFAEVRRTEGDNAEGLPDILLAWRG